MIGPSKQQPWYYDSDVHHYINYNLPHLALKKESEYTLIEGGKTDYEKVNTLYLQSPVPGYNVSRVEIVYNSALTRRFEGNVMLLNARAENPAFAPNWDQEDNLSIRTRINAALKKITITHPSTYQHVQLMPAFHGTKAGLLDSIFKTGFASLAATDNGFFGKGIYSTSSAEYAHRVYSDGTILYNWVVFFSAYPVTLADMLRLIGGPAYSNYDAHYTLVAPSNPLNPNEVVYFPITEFTNPTYDELVVFDPANVLPRYKITLASNGLYLLSPALQGTHITLIYSMTGCLAQYGDLPGDLMKNKIVKLKEKPADPLNTAELLILNIIESIKVEKNASVIQTLFYRIGKLIEPSPSGNLQNSVVPAPSTHLTTTDSPPKMKTPPAATHFKPGAPASLSPGTEKVTVSPPISTPPKTKTPPIVPHFSFKPASSTPPFGHAKPDPFAPWKK